MYVILWVIGYRDLSDPVQLCLLYVKLCAVRRSNPLPLGLYYTVISRKVVGKSARDNPERHCGWFWVLFFSKKFERMAQKAMEMCLRVLKESNKSRQLTATVVRNSVLIISHITFWDCHVHIFSDNLSQNSCRPFLREKVPLFVYLSGDFVTNSYGESWDSSCEKIMSPSPESLSPSCNHTVNLKTDS